MEDNNCIEKKDGEKKKKKMTKQHSFLQKNKIKAKFGKVQNAQNRRWYSTKVISNFVPNLKPKKSFCKPTPFQLDGNSSNKKENDNKFELDKISSCDEEESYQDSSSDFDSDIEEEKDLNIDSNNNIIQNSINDIQNVESKLSKDVLISTKDETDSSFECHNSDHEENDEKEKEKEEEKEITEKKEDKNVNKLNNKIIKDDFNLDGNKNNDLDDDINKKEFDINKKNYLSHKNVVFHNNISSILDILSVRNKKK